MVTAQLKDTVKQIFAAYLERNSHRKTPERFAILDEVYSHNGHFDVESLYLTMKDKNYSVSRATLYNTIELLLACNLVRRHQFGKSIAQFEKAHSNKQHHHLICTECNAVIEFCDPRIQGIKNSIRTNMKFEVLHHSLNLYGVCNTCQLKINNQTTT